MICVHSAPAPATSRDCADLAGLDMIPEGIYVEWHDDSETEEAGTDNVASGFEAMSAETTTATDQSC